MEEKDKRAINERLNLLNRGELISVGNLLLQTLDAAADEVHNTVKEWRKLFPPTDEEAAKIVKTVSEQGKAGGDNGDTRPA